MRNAFLFDDVFCPFSFLLYESETNERFQVKKNTRFCDESFSTIMYRTIRKRIDSV